MNSRLIWQQFKALFFVQSLFAILMAAPDAAAASIDIKDTNYPIPKNAYFVSPNGVSSNSGKSPNSPWPVSKAVGSAPTGSTIIFRGGTYRNKKVYVTKKLTLQPYPHEKAWLKGSIVVDDWVADGNTWRKNGWTYSFPLNVSSIYLDPQYPLAGNRDMVYINGVSLKQVASKAEVVPGTFYVDYNNDRLYIGSNPGGKTVEATAQVDAFAMWKEDGSDPTGTVVRGLGFAHYAEQGVTVGAPRVMLENNTFVWNGVSGAYFSAESAGVPNVSTDGIVRGNTFSYNGRKGLGGDRAHRLLVEGNTSSYNNIEHFYDLWDAAGIKIVRSDKSILRKNLVEKNYSTGIWIDVSSTNTTLVHNVVRHNDLMGIWFEVSHKAIIASNVVHNNSTGIYVLDSSSARVYNNTLSMNGKGLRVADGPRVNGDAGQYRQGLTWIARDNVFKNNIISNTTGGEFFQASSCDPKKKSSLLLSGVDYNAYYRTSSSLPSTIIRWSPSAEKCNVEYDTLDTFRSANNYEAKALVIENVTTNPFFIDHADGDYRLKSNSPAIRRGSPVPDDVARATGLPSGRSVDLGALQTN